MKLKYFTWSCLSIAVIAVAYSVFSGSEQNNQAVSLFTSTMILMSVGFDLVRRELAKLRPPDRRLRGSST